MAADFVEDRRRRFYLFFLTKSLERDGLLGVHEITFSLGVIWTDGLRIELEKETGA